MKLISEIPMGIGLATLVGSAATAGNGKEKGKDMKRIASHAKHLMWGFALLLPVLLAGCGGTWNGPTLTAIAVAPLDQSVPKAAVKQFTATGISSDGTSADLTGQVAWSSANTAIATVDTRGLATGVSVGVATITATFAGKTVSTSLTVTPALLRSIAVAPAAPSIARGLGNQFTALGIYSDGTSQDLTGLANWLSANQAVATIAPATGLATGVGAGQTAISATFGGQTGSATLTVTAATLNSISVTPGVASIAKSQTSQFTALGIYSDGTSEVLTSSAAWQSGSPAVATLNADGLAGSGLATGVATGSSLVTASFGGLTGSATLSVAAATLNSITVTPAVSSIVKGQTGKLTAMGTYSDGSSADITASAVWASLNTGVATMNPNLLPASGLATGVAAGQAVITATFGGKLGSAELTVTAATLRSITVAPASMNLVKGLAGQFTALGTYSDNNTADLTADVVWSSNDVNVATMNPDGSAASGLATAVDAGNAGIMATLGLISGNAALTVSTATLNSITIAPAAASIAKGASNKFIALGTYNNGTSADLTSQVTWASLDTTVATMNANFFTTSGLATGVMAGTAGITATFNGKTGNATLAVTPVNLGLAAKYGIFGGSAGMTNQGIQTVITGSNGNTADIGTIATTTSSITGFHDSAPSDIYTETPANIGLVTGKIYTCTNSTTGPTLAAANAASCRTATQGKLAAESAYAELVAMPIGPNPDQGAGFLDGLTLAPGVYKAAGGSFKLLAVDLTLDALGDPNATFVFQMATSLTVGGADLASSRTIVLKNGAQAKNVFWQVGSAATINPAGGGTMVGTIISMTGISFSTAGSVVPLTLEGRALSLGASVTMVNTLINVPAP